jgi:hypothetical protein
VPRKRQPFALPLDTPPMGSASRRSSRARKVHANTSPIGTVFAVSRSSPAMRSSSEPSRVSRSGATFLRSCRWRAQAEIRDRDGELVVELEAHLAFDASQMRLHPAESRTTGLAAATPARLIVFDMLVGTDGATLLDQPLKQRRATLEGFMAKAMIPKKLLISPPTRIAGLSRRGAVHQWRDHKATDGSVFAWRSDEIKVKRPPTADCGVSGTRYQHNSRKVGLLLLGLYDNAEKI